MDLEQRPPQPPSWRPPGSDTGDVSLGIIVGVIGSLALVGLVTIGRLLWHLFRG